MARRRTPTTVTATADEHGHAHDGHDHGHHEPVYPENPVPLPDVISKPVDLVPNVIHPDVLWACTSCRACEEQCPVMISYVDKIVDMRRNLVIIKGEFPAELQKPFQGMEVNGNPWNLARIDRANWADGLGIPTHGREARRAGALLGRLRRQLRRPRQEDRARHGAS